MRLLERRRGWAAAIAAASGLATAGCCMAYSSDDGADMQTSANVGQSPTRSLSQQQRPTEPLVIEESDLVKLDGDWLYVHNARTGLHVVDVVDPREPLRVGQVEEITGDAGEIYVTPAHAVLIVEQPDLCSDWLGTAVISVTSPTAQPEVAATECLRGEPVSSRLIGDVLYVVTAAQDAETLSTSVRSFDVSQAGIITAVESEEFPGLGHELHVTHEAIYVTEPIGEQGTRLHYLDIAEGDGSIIGRDSIDVVGAPMGRFHMSEYEDAFRIVTRLGEESNQKTHLTVIDVSDPDHLAQIGSLAGIAPGETLFATRFVGDRAYVVTYEPEVIVDEVVVQVGWDPLWIVSLADPTRPVVLSELKIPGWSDYIFPRGDRLLAVGRGDEGRGVAASLFDVSDPTAPAELTRLEFGNDNAVSEANSDFRGVTVVEDQLGAPPLVVVPYTDNIGLVPQCRPEHHVQLIDLWEDELEFAGNLRMPGKVRRTLPVSDTLYVVSERAVSATDVADRDAPQTVARVTVDDAVRIDTCEFPPEPPQVVQTVRVEDWEQEDPEGLPDLCGCATATKPSTCFGKNAGWLVVAGLFAFGFSWRRRRQRRRAAKGPSAS